MDKWLIIGIGLMVVGTLVTAAIVLIPPDEGIYETCSKHVECEKYGGSGFGDKESEGCCNCCLDRGYEYYYSSHCELPECDYTDKCICDSFGSQLGI